MKTAYIVKGYRTAVGKAPKGSLRFMRSDDMAAQTISYLLSQVPEFDHSRIDDLIVGNAMPEGEQGLNLARLISLMGLSTDKVPGLTINRFCASGLEAIGIAVAKIQNGMADCIIAGGVENMSQIPMGGARFAPAYSVTSKGLEDYYWNMGLTAEAVAAEYNISREDQDQFAFESHNKALNAIDNQLFKDQIVPLNIEQVFVDENNQRATRNYEFSVDEGPRRGTSFEGLSGLRTVFAAKGSVTAGNSSQTSDGAAFVLVMSEEMVKELGVSPVARLISLASAGLPPRIMGVGPIYAIPKALKQAGLHQNEINLIELNEAFASQGLAVIKELGLDPSIINPHGGAIALGHPLGCTGAKLSVQLFDEMSKRKLKYGVVTMCVGTGQGTAGVYEIL
ncbi:acetyl-CoA C-acyltransferase [Aquiflexum lacus]|uniref:acetyl-CoA C-acyltransferase n=1 Tax=Aquiflexum lacus TaxID=2483805 RepID=UPI001893926D|nr:acetyl-CoA C-acyltransferase [Aquiflexum lacus]